MASVEIVPHKGDLSFTALFFIERPMRRTTTLGQIDELSVYIYKLLRGAHIRCEPYATIYAQRDKTVIQVDVTAPPPPNGDRMLALLQEDVYLAYLFEPTGIGL